MTLYAANIMDLAKPVKKGKKEVAVEENVDAEKPVKQKREMTEKQKAALKKAKETRKRKREEELEKRRVEDEAIENKKKELDAKAEELVKKKAEMAEKRRLKREEKKKAVGNVEEEKAVEVCSASTTADESNTSSVGDAVEQAVEKVVKKKKVKETVKDGEPPAWFKKYIEGVKTEEQKVKKDKRPVKVKKAEAQVEAKQLWDDGFTRNRVQQEVDSHMSRMYSQIFGQRRLK
jgi:hypothetical protein